MGLKKNKATRTSRLTCQYVGSFVVKDGDNTHLPTSQQKRIVDEKLKSCKKKLIQGMAVVLEVSPDGLKVLDTDEKTVKMAHALRRISYATAESSNKLFAYVSHQPGTSMEVVCHTFLTKKKDHAEALSYMLGKFFKQTFAYTLKNRDKLEAAAEKRGAGRKWAKQQIADGHTISNNAQTAAQRAKRQAANDAVASPEHKRTQNGSQVVEPRTQREPTSSSRETGARHRSGVTQEETIAQIHSKSSQSPTKKPLHGQSHVDGAARHSGTPDSGTSSNSRNSQHHGDEAPPPLPKRNYIAKESGEYPSKSPGNGGRVARRLSEQGDMQPSPSSNARKRSTTEEVQPTWLMKQTPLNTRDDIDGPGPGSSSQPSDSWIAFGDDDNVTNQNLAPSLEDEDWYIPGVTKEYVFEMLEASDIGTFFVRDSQSCPGCYALTVKVIKNPNNPSGFGNYLIMPVENGFSLQGFDKTFANISMLIRHYAHNEDGLPCRLILAGSNPLFHDSNGYLVEFMDEEDDMYTTLSNCTSMFQELKLKGDASIWS